MGQRGDVIDIGMFVFSMMEVGDGIEQTRQSTGRVIQMPNMHIFTQALTNENIAFDFIWHEVAVVISFESDWRRAKALLEEIVARRGGDVIQHAEAQVQRATNQYLVKAGPLTPTVFTRVIDHGIELSMRFLTEVRQPRVVEAAIWEDVLQAFAAEPGIELAYPTSRVVRNTEEGKINTAHGDASAAAP
jgi:small-conductance mechanosensitive channel